MKKIGVTGGSGFIGQHLIKYLLKKNYKIKSCDLINPKNIILNNKNFIFKKIDIYDEKTLLSFFSDVDCIIHLAASLGVQNTEKNSLDCLDINILGTKKILNVVKKNKIKKFIFSSSSEVYGDQKKFPLREDYEFRVKSTYALSKITSEFYVRSYSKKFNLNCNIVRFFNVYGEDQKKFCYTEIYRSFVKIKKFVSLW